MMAKRKRGIRDTMAKKEKELDFIKDDVEEIKSKILSREHAFKGKELVEAFIGAMIIGLTFLFKGLLLDIGLNLQWKNIIVIIIFSLVVLYYEIYYLNYLPRKTIIKNPGLFMINRMILTYSIAVIVSFVLVSIFGLIYYTKTFLEMLKIVFILSMPCSLGAVISKVFK